MGSPGGHNHERYRNGVDKPVEEVQGRGGGIERDQFQSLRLSLGRHTVGTWADNSKWGDLYIPKASVK